MSNQPKLPKPGGAKRVAEHFESIREECRTSVQESSENYTVSIAAETNVNQPDDDPEAVVSEEDFVEHFSQLIPSEPEYVSLPEYESNEER